MMVKDITKAIKRLNLIAKHKHITLPIAPTADKDKKQLTYGLNYRAQCV